MHKDTILVMCSPDIRRLNARRAIGSIKATDLSRAELYVIDNGFDPQFNPSVVMNDMLRLAGQTGKNLVILEDDIGGIDCRACHFAPPGSNNRTRRAA